MKEKIEISKEELKRIYEWLRTAKINTEHLFQRLNQKWPEYMSRDIDDILNKVYVMLDGKGTPCVYQIQYFAYEEEYAQEPTQMNGGLFSSIINARADLVQLEKELGDDLLQSRIIKQEIDGNRSVEIFSRNYKK